MIKSVDTCPFSKLRFIEKNLQLFSTHYFVWLCFFVKRKDDLEKFHLLPKVQMTKSASYARAINIFTMTSKGVIYYLQIPVKTRIIHIHLIQLPKSEKGQMHLRLFLQRNYARRFSPQKLYDK